MKLEKRSSGPEEPASQESKPSGGKKPVIVYIMILFIAAFLLMAFSFLMHQRSNTEALGKLQDSVSALQAVQATQDENVSLQEQLKAAQAQMDDLQKKADDAADAQTDLQGQLDALSSLYVLQQQFAAKDYDACKQTIQNMESTGQSSLLSKDAGSGVTSPADRYQQLKEAVMSK